MGMMMLAGCSSSVEEEMEEMEQAVVPEPEPVDVGMLAYAVPYTNAVQQKGRAESRRFGAAPAWMTVGDINYLPYDELAGSGTAMMSNEKAAISVFFTKDSPVTTELHKIWKGSDDKWRIDEAPETGGDYYLYGYVPRDAATASILPDATSSLYADGIRLTLNGLPTVASKDVCVVVGAKEGIKTSVDPAPLEVSVTGLKTGQFLTNFKTGDAEENHLFLLFDHIYSALTFRFTVDEEYDKLRTIKVKQVELMAYEDDRATKKYSKQNTTVTLKANDTNTSPITGTVTFTQDTESARMGYVDIFNNSKTPLVLGYGVNRDATGFVPRDINHLMLRSTYDVYDKQGNLVRKDCKAENKFSLSGLSFTPDNFIYDDEADKNMLKRGYRYIVKVLVTPTYLYVLSEPDLDNPDVVIED